MTMRLSKSSLEILPDGILRPNYDRETLTPAIVHIGVGNFHRAHQAMYMHELFEQGIDHDWAIVGAGLMPADSLRRTLLSKQDWLTTVVELGSQNPNATLVGSMVDFCEVGSAPLLERIVDPAIRIVSLTITEGGYYIDQATGSFDEFHPDIVHDRMNFNSPKTVFGVLLRALWLRQEMGLPLFTILSCDNLIENGDVVHNALKCLAKGIPEVSLRWVEDDIVCPNSMVDCITPATTIQGVDFIAEKYGYKDMSPVFSEPFRQWVIEDRFANGRPQLERVGVEFTQDVRPYEDLKLNILNAGHASIAYVGALIGLRYAHDAMEDQDISAWLEAVMKREVLPTLSPVAETTTESYLSSVIDRFSNPGINDALTRLCEDGENRQPKFIFPSIRRALAAGLPIDGLALETALWCRYLADNPSGNAVVSDAAKATKNDSEAFIIRTEIFGDLKDSDIFRKAFTENIRRLWTESPRRVIRDYVGASRTRK